RVGNVSATDRGVAGVTVDVLHPDHEPTAAGVGAGDVRVLDDDVARVPKAHAERLASYEDPHVLQRDVRRGHVDIGVDLEAVEDGAVPIHLKPAAVVPMPAGTLGDLR